MGLFTELGRRVEGFKQTAKGVAENTETSQCPACDAEFDGPRDQCPKCGEEMGESTGTTD